MFLTGCGGDTNMPRMDSEIERLEELMKQFVARHEAGLAQLSQARLRISELEAENARLATKVDAAIERVNAMLNALPQMEED